MHADLNKLLSTLGPNCNLPLISPIPPMVFIILLFRTINFNKHEARRLLVAPCEVDPPHHPVLAAGSGNQNTSRVILSELTKDLNNREVFKDLASGSITEKAVTWELLWGKY